MKHVLPSSPQLKDLLIQFHLYHITFNSPKTSTLTLTFQKGIQIIGQVDSIVPMSRLKVKFNPKTTVPIKFRSINIQQSIYEICLFQLDQEREVFLQCKTINLVHFLKQCLDKLNKLHIEMEKKVKQQTEIAIIWRRLREDFIQKEYYSEVKFTHFGATLSFKFQMRHQYDDIVQRADRAEKLRQMMKKQAKQIFHQSDSLPDGYMDKVFKELGVFTEKVINDPQNADLDNPMSIKKDVKDFVRHFDEKYKMLNLPRLIQRLAISSRQEQDKHAYQSVEANRETPINSHQQDGYASIETFAGGLRYKTSSDRLSNSPIKLNKSIRNSVLKIRPNEQTTEGTYSGIRNLLFLMAAFWIIYALMHPLSCA